MSTDIKTISNTDNTSTIRFMTSIIRGLRGFSGAAVETFVAADDIVMSCIYDFKTTHP